MKINKALILNKIAGSDFTLSPTQSKISIPILERIYKKMANEIQFGPIWVFDEKLIIDGHHRYIASLLADFNLEHTSTIRVPEVHIELKWKDVVFVNEEWDTEANINRLNEEDAKFNKMTIEQIEQILK